MDAALQQQIERAVPALGESWIAPADAIRDGDWTGITRRAREAMAIVRATLA